MAEPNRRIPFLEHLGVEFVAIGDGRSTLRLPIRPELCNSVAAAHGGVVMTLLDACMTLAARSNYADESRQPLVCVTVEMKTSFIRPGSGALVARGTTVHKGGSVIFCEGEIVDAGGSLVARGSGTFKPVQPRPGGPPRPADG